MMDGEIGVDSTPGQGSTFWFELPLETGLAVPSETTTKTAEAVDDFGSVEHPRILLVEDNHINQKLALAMLTSLGESAEVAENGRIAVEMMQSRSDEFDLILMDCQMPEMDGYEATGITRKHTLGAEVPIIAMTANAMVGDREKCLRAGMNDHLVKGITKQSLGATVKNGPPAGCPPRPDQYA